MCLAFVFCVFSFPELISRLVGRSVGSGRIGSGKVVAPSVGQSVCRSSVRRAGRRSELKVQLERVTTEKLRQQHEVERKRSERKAATRQREEARIRKDIDDAQQAQKTSRWIQRVSSVHTEGWS